MDNEAKADEKMENLNLQAQKYDWEKARERILLLSSKKNSPADEGRTEATISK